MKRMATPHPAPTHSSPTAGAEIANGTGPSFWHKSAPKPVRRAFASGDYLRGRTAWQAYLAGRTAPAPPDSLLPVGGNPVRWALPDGLDLQPAAPWLDRAGRLPAGCPKPDPQLESELLGWLAESTGAAAGARYALDAVAAARAIAHLAAIVSPEVWWPLLEHLLAAAADAAAIDLEQDPLVHQLLVGELPLTLAYLLPEITPCRRLKSSARRALSSGLIDLLDGVGFPHGTRLGLLRPLLACWTRCSAMGGELKGGAWSKAAENQYRWLIRQALRLTRHDGTQVLCTEPAGAFSHELFAAALHFGGDRDDHRIAARVLPRSKRTPKTRGRRWALPASAYNSEWAAAAVLRPRWSRSSPRLSVVYPEQQVLMELNSGRELLCCGPWHFEVRADGRPALPDSDWQQLCWFSDKHVDFLELEIELTAGVRIQRQLLLAREDRFLLLADVVLAAEPARVDYRGRLPLCPTVSFQPADQSREGFLTGGKPRALVLPLALPEWRADRGTGRLTQTAGGLELRQSTPAGRLYAPLFLDLDPRRMTRPCTWRRLTVAESLAVQPHEVAVGYRVAVGKAQWLLYRSLAEKANRTLLGHNLSTEMLLARFRRSGKVDPLLEIE